MPTPLEHFSSITTQILKDFETQGLLRLMTADNVDIPLLLDSPEGQATIERITTRLYEGVVKDMNTHLAPDLA